MFLIEELRFVSVRQRLEPVNTILQQLCTDLNARAALLSDIYGRVYAKCGELGDMPEETLSALMSGGFATLMEAGRTIDDDAGAVYLAYREGKHRNLYSINVGAQYLVMVIIERGVYRSAGGSLVLCPPSRTGSKPGGGCSITG